MVFLLILVVSGGFPAILRQAFSECFCFWYFRCGLAVSGEFSLSLVMLRQASGEGFYLVLLLFLVFPARYACLLHVWSIFDEASAKVSFFFFCFFYFFVLFFFSSISAGVVLARLVG